MPKYHRNIIGILFLPPDYITEYIFINVGSDTDAVMTVIMLST